MATAVLEVEAKDLPSAVTGLDGYERALILFRYGGRPVARSIVRVRDGSIPRVELALGIGEWGWRHITQLSLRERLQCPEISTPARLPSATIAVCTRDRPEDLRRCLAGIVLVHGDFDLLVVDNCPSSDATEKVCREFGSVRYVREPRPGLDHARNCALQAASTEVVAFIDDDAVPDRHWLRELLMNFNGPNVLCVTGLTMPLELETPAQEQFEAYSPFGRGFYRRVFAADRHHPLIAGAIGAGVNMALRREVVELVGGFDNALDSGTATKSGGDHEMLTRILRAGYRVVYEPAALNWHRHRRSETELKQTLYGYGVGVYSSFIRALVHDRDLRVFQIAYNWFRHSQARQLARSLLKRPGAHPLDLVLAELRGCLAAPRAYWRSTRQLKRAGTPRDR